VIRFPPGSLPWLLAHEMRLTWRTTMGKRGAVRTAIVLGGLGLLALVASAPIALSLARRTVTLTPVLTAELDVALLLLFSLMLSQTLSGAVLAFYTRGDLDLLLSSPISGRKVLAVRAIGLALAPFLVYAALVTPFVLPAAATGHPAWLAAYVVLAAVAMLATAAGVGLAIALFAVIGPRATRTVGQLLAALVGASVYLTFQARNIFPDHGAATLRRLVAFANVERFGPGAPLAWPAHALVGEPLPLLIVATVAGLAFFAIVAGLGRRFIADAGVGSGTDSGQAFGRRPGRSRSNAAPARFASSPFNAIVRKEWRLLLRDPTLLSQVVLRLLYLLPTGFFLFRNVGLHDTTAVARGAGALTFFVGQLAGSLAWIAISAEDAPELIACSPIGPGAARRAKLAAALTPVALMVAPVLVGLAWLSPWAALVATVSTAVSAISAALLNLWFEKPTPRSAFRRRGGSVVVSLGELALGVCWGLAAALAILTPRWALLPVLVGLGLLGVFRAVGDPKRLY
jgi:ABC-2 type transport system permease protein